MDEFSKEKLSKAVKSIVERAFQEAEFDKIADAIRYVYETTKEEDMIVALDFYKRIRAIKSMIGQGGTGGGNCHLWDNVPTGCGEVHGLLHLDYTLVNCVTEKLIDFNSVIEGICLCDDHWGYGPPACNNLDGLLCLDYELTEPNFVYDVAWGEVYASN